QDPLNERVADDIVFVQVDKSNSIDVAQAVGGVGQAAARLLGQIDLRDVAGDDDLRALAHARQEHHHLRHRRVLALVEDDDRLVKGPAAHIRQWDYFYYVIIHISFNGLR